MNIFSSLITMQNVLSNFLYSVAIFYYNFNKVEVISIFIEKLLFRSCKVVEYRAKES